MHHTLIHSSGKSAPDAHATHYAQLQEETASDEGEEDFVESSSCNVALTTRVCTTALLGTTLIMVKGRDNKFYKARALIDSGAMTSLCTKAFAERAGLTLEAEEPAIYGLGDQRVNTTTGATWCLIKPCNKKEPVFKTRTIIINQITGQLPPKKLRADIYERFSKLKLADENFNNPGEIDFLLGADVFPYIYSGKRIAYTQDQPLALDSVFGWVITGRCPTEKGSEPVSLAYFSRIIEDTKIDLQNFWVRKEPPPCQSREPTTPPRLATPPPPDFSDDEGEPLRFSPENCWYAENTEAAPDFLRFSQPSHYEAPPPPTPALSGAERRKQRYLKFKHQAKRANRSLPQGQLRNYDAVRNRYRASQHRRNH